MKLQVTFRTVMVWEESFHKMCVDNKIRKEEMQRRNEDNYEKEKIIGNRNERNVYSSINDRLWQQQRSKRL